MIKRGGQAGFTAVELLVTLFVAAAFLVASYQLFNVIIKDGGNARAESRAQNVAYDYMRRYAASATNPCTTQTLLSDSALNIDSLSNVIINVSLSCPAYSTTSLTQVNVTISYNTPKQTVKYSTYTNGSSVAGIDNTDGLQGWWKFNGSGTRAIGNTDATITGAVPTTGQNGLANNAYLFNGTSGYGLVNSTFGLGTTNVTLSFWINNPTTTNYGEFVKVGGTNGYGIGIGAANYSSASTGTKLIMLYEGVRWIVTGKDIGTGWHHIVMTVSGTGGIVPTAYFDGAVVAGSYSGTGTVAPTVGTYIGGGSAASRYFNGSIDDVRIYNRVLSPTEISLIYSAGAK